jgi:hypothetical protein
MDKDTERKETIRKLRESVNLIRRHLPGDEEGLLVFGTGVAIISTNYPHWKQTDEHSIKEIREMYMVSHESVHLSQIISTEFVFYTGFGFSELVAHTQKNTKQNIPEHVWLAECLETFNHYNDLLEKESDGISALQLIETHAVLEGFRGAFSRYSQEGLIMIIKEAHDLNMLYSDLIGEFLKDYGFDFTFNVVSKVCWLSLQSKYPGTAFIDYINKLLEFPVKEVIKLNGYRLCILLGLDPVQLSTSLRQRNPDINSHPINKLWGPYFDVIEEETDSETLLEFFMHPGKKTSSEKLKHLNMMPPLTIYDDDRFILNGPHKNDGWNAAEPLIKATEVYLETLFWIDAKYRADAP